MENILVLTHVDESGVLSRASLESVAAGVELSSALSAKLSIGVVAVDAAAVAAQLAGLNACVLAATSPELAEPRFSSDAAACEALCRTAAPSIVLAPGSSRFTRVLPAVAHRLGGVTDTHITLLTGGAQVEATRWFYRQRVEAVITRTARPWFLLLDAGTRTAYAGSGAAPTVESAAITMPALRTKVLGIKAPKQDEQTIRPDAKLLFVAGAGWTKKQADGQVHATDAEALILGFLRNADASLGSSKSLVDQSGENQSVLNFMTHLNQIGQTGSTPRHAKGLSTCCHGCLLYTSSHRPRRWPRAQNSPVSCGGPFPSTLTAADAPPAPGKWA